MEITNVIISNSFFDFVLKNKALSFFYIIIFLTIIIIVGVIFYNFQTTEKGKFCIFVFFSILFALSLCLFPFYVSFVPEVYDPSWGYDASNRFGYDKFYSVFDGRTDKYIVEYNIENSKKETMTTQESLDTIYNKKYFKLKKDNDNCDIIYNHVKTIEDNTYDQKIKQEEQKQREQYNELSQKYLNETHKVNIKK